MGSGGIGGSVCGGGCLDEDGWRGWVGDGVGCRW